MHRSRIWHSLRWRLPVLIATLIAVVLFTFLWAAYQTVRTTVIRAAGDRAQRAADQVASLLDGRRSIDQMSRIAVDADLRRYLQQPTEETRELARKRLSVIAQPGPRRVELWDAAGARVI